MELYENLKIMDIVEDDSQVKFYAVDENTMEAHEVKFNKQLYDKSKNKWIDDPVQLAKVDGYCKEYFNLPLEEISNAIGQNIDVYSYDSFESFWKVDAKFDQDMVGQIIPTTIDSIELTNEGIVIRFPYEDEIYRSNMKFTDNINGTYYVNIQKKKNALKRFEKNYGVPIEEKDSLVGQNINVEVKSFGPNVYAEVKPLPKKKK